MNPIMQNGEIPKEEIPKVSKEQISFVKDLLVKKGLSAETWVRQICAQRGINVNEFMEQFRDVPF